MKMLLGILSSQVTSPPSQRCQQMARYGVSTLQHKQQLHGNPAARDIVLAVLSPTGSGAIILEHGWTAMLHRSNAS